MGGVVGIRREDKNKWERRVPLTPDHVRKLIQEGFEVVVQPSAIRVFPDDEYARAGATVQESLSPCDVVFAVKEIPIDLLERGKTYVFFSHVIKGQHHNMPMLRRLMDLGCNLIEYERVTDASGKRLIFFGTHAGYAGMIDTLHVLGRRMRALGVATPFETIGMGHAYATLAAAEAHIREAGEAIERSGLPEPLAPMIVGFTGYGHVSIGAQEVFDYLPFKTIPARDLPGIDPASLSNRVVYKTVFREEDLVEPRDHGGRFDLAEYYQHPERYAGVFGRYLPKLSVLVNCVYWDQRYPRLVTREALQRLYAPGATPRLQVIGDISCDLEGAVECTVRVTDPDQPTYVYLPEEDRVADGVEGRGPVILAIDNLPCELAREASEFFGDVLMPFVESIAGVERGRLLAPGELPEEIRRAVIVHRGELTPDYRYLTEFLPGKETIR